MTWLRLRALHRRMKPDFWWPWWPGYARPNAVKKHVIAKAEAVSCALCSKMAAPFDDGAYGIAVGFEAAGPPYK